MTRVVIAGGGIGGLCAALALHAHGVEVEIHEQASELREVGAGLTLTRGAMRCLDALGLADAIRRVSGPSPRMPFVHYRSARRLWGEMAGDEVGDGEDDGRDPGAPIVARHIFRADLQQVLAAALRARAPGALRLGHALTSVHGHDDRVELGFADGTLASADVLIGADGLRSTVRRAFWDAAPPDYTGQVAWRFLLDGPIARPHLSVGRAAVFVGPDRTFNRYTLRGGALLNCVALVRTPGWQEEGWAIPGDPQELAALFEDWHPEVRALVALAGGARLHKWALGARAPLATWQAGRVALLGDAAHPMLPFLGLGAAMAIEDAVLLGRAFAIEPDALRALSRYDAARRPRATLAAELSRRQGIELQAQDPDRFVKAEAPIDTAALFDYEPASVAV